ncbi:hypothetical protein BpHYR1_052849 [Brachionus plicatilis]|uniref:Uncharacterized protein n=1 Tax=Brachionus plicatilis TaxID=10195 RepID=A0A3M7RJF2_BRAPC|nr:hypothetical protein BpHYR1_052849 [Brachionus plicatilis]
MSKESLHLSNTCILKKSRKQKCLPGNNAPYITFQGTVVEIGFNFSVLNYLLPNDAELKLITLEAIFDSLPATLVTPSLKSCFINPISVEL